MPACNVYDFSQGLVTYRDNEWPNANVDENGLQDDTNDRGNPITVISADGVWTMSMYRTTMDMNEYHTRTFVLRKRVGDVFIYSSELHSNDPMIKPDGGYNLSEDQYKIFLSKDGAKVAILYEGQGGGLVITLFTNDIINGGLTRVARYTLQTSPLLDPGNILPPEYWECSPSQGYEGLVRLMCAEASLDLLYIPVRVESSSGSLIGMDMFKYSINWNTAELVLIDYVPVYSGISNISAISVSENGTYIAIAVGLPEV
ncbi:MAG: hypothetical protein DRQ39_03685 [Gammaproteobacteria bacterium]|nr:MAG: hypothetical protein DRQ39_03685 [Gammaproteobacteria bacterium]RKZ94699.1 MAG: hypothetical protein DRQ40_05295 [Gammaproteobacteria bacterium]